MSESKCQPACMPSPSSRRRMILPHPGQSSPRVVKSGCVSRANSKVTKTVIWPHGLLYTMYGTHQVMMTCSCTVHCWLPHPGEDRERSQGDHHGSPWGSYVWASLHLASDVGLGCHLVSAATKLQNILKRCWSQRLPPQVPRLDTRPSNSWQQPITRHVNQEQALHDNRAPFITAIVGQAACPAFTKGTCA